MEILWAITMVVLPCLVSMRFSSICSSVSVSTAESESSSMRIAESFKSALAIELRCFWPPESVTPRSPTMVLYSSGKPMILSCIHASFAACFTASRIAGLSAILSSRPNAIFSSSVSENRKFSCGTYEISRCKTASG